MRTLFVTSLVALFSLSCGTEIPDQDTASKGQAVTSGGISPTPAYPLCLGWDNNAPRWCIVKCKGGIDRRIVVRRGSDEFKGNACETLADGFCGWNGWGNADWSCWGGTY